RSVTDQPRPTAARTDKHNAGRFGQEQQPYIDKAKRLRTEQKTSQSHEEITWNAGFSCKFSVMPTRHKCVCAGFSCKFSVMPTRHKCVRRIQLEVIVNCADTA
ncbi:hypothetical protein BaRGS_00033867, partial [Batillaria attramentaria]